MNKRRKEEQRRALLQRNFPFLGFVARKSHTRKCTHRRGRNLSLWNRKYSLLFFSLYSHNRLLSFQQGFSTSALLTFELDNSSLGGASLRIVQLCSIPGLQPLNARSPPLAVTTQHTSRYCQGSWGGKEGGCSPGENH